MQTSLFFARLIANRADFPANMTDAEGAAMAGHFAFLSEMLAAGRLVVAGPVLDPAGMFGLGVFEAQSIEEVRNLLARDPAGTIGRYEVVPMGNATYRPAVTTTSKAIPMEILTARNDV